MMTERKTRKHRGMAERCGLSGRQATRQNMIGARELGRVSRLGVKTQQGFDHHAIGIGDSVVARGEGGDG